MSDFELPNIRRMLVPDPGYIILDCDLAGADAQVVAWEAEDEDLKAAFRAGLKVHVKNATDIWGSKFTSLAPSSPQWDLLYDQTKRAVHGTNYIGSARTISITLGWPLNVTEQFQRRWFALHPGISRWHDRVRLGLETSRSVSNRFGFVRHYFERVTDVLPEAVAWGPQSTVAITCRRGAFQLEDHLPWVQILLDVHDSLVLQIPRRRIADVELIRRHLLNPIPYDDPLTIQWGLALSPVSWGDVQKMSWEEAATMKF